MSTVVLIADYNRYLDWGWPPTPLDLVPVRYVYTTSTSLEPVF